MPAAGWSKAAALAAIGGPYQTVLGLPPEPWPDIPDGFVFGPEWAEPGSIYLFDQNDALARMAAHGNTLAWVEQHLLGFGWVIDGTGTWVMPVRYARAQVVASLPGPEQIIHSLAFRPVDESVNVTGQVLNDFALVLAGYFADMLAINPLPQIFSQNLVYKQINISYIEQTQGTDSSGGGGDQKTLVPTVVVPIEPGIHTLGDQQMLPYEVACALTLQTDTRGPRTRGRVYMGGLTVYPLQQANGLFSQASVSAIGNAFGTAVVQQVHDNTDWRLNIVSRRGATAREVQGISVGIVPDSQRRRRNALQEAYTQAWGTPPGAIPPG